MNYYVNKGSHIPVEDFTIVNNTSNDMNVMASLNAVDGGGMTVVGADNGTTTNTGYYTEPFSLPANGTFADVSFTLNVPETLEVGDTGHFYFLVSGASDLPDSSAGSYVFVNIIVTPSDGYVHFREDFEGMHKVNGKYRLPSDWTTIADNHTNYSQFSSLGRSWAGFDLTETNKVVVSVSYFTVSDSADRWLITPQITIPYDRMCLSFKVYGYDATFQESIKIMVSTTGNNKEDFTHRLLYVPRVPQGESNYLLDLSDYTGQTVYVAFVNCGYNGYYVCVDDVSVLIPQSNEIALTSLTTSQFASIAERMPIAGTITNNGVADLQSYDIYYVVNHTDTSQVYSVYGINIPYGGTHTFVHNSPFTPTVGENTIEVFVANPNESPDNSNDNSMTTTIYGYDGNKTQPRTSLLENFTSLYCGNCPAAHEVIHETAANRDDIIIVSHHVGYEDDALTLNECHNLLRYYNSNTTYAPAIMLDRTYFGGSKFADEPCPVFTPLGAPDLSECFDIANSVPSFVKVYFSALSYDNDTRTLTATVKGEFTGDCEGIFAMESPSLSLYLTEDSIIRSQYGGQNPYRHDNTIRATLSNINGDAGIITSTTEGSTFEKTYTYTLPSQFKADYCRLVAFVNNNTNDVFNSKVANTVVSDYIGRTYAGINDVANISFRTYPNPADDIVYVESSENIDNIVITNMLGQRVYEQNHIGNTNITINTKHLPAGLYLITVNGKGCSTSKHINIVR